MVINIKMVIMTCKNGPHLDFLGGQIDFEKIWFASM